MTAEELAIKYGFYRWDSVEECYICSPDFIDDVNKVIASQRRSLVPMYFILRKHLLNIKSPKYK